MFARIATTNNKQQTWQLHLIASLMNDGRWSIHKGETGQVSTSSKREPRLESDDYNYRGATKINMKL